MRCLHPGLLSVKRWLSCRVHSIREPTFCYGYSKAPASLVGPILNQWNLSVFCVKIYFFCLIFRVPPHPATVGIITCLPGDPHLNQNFCHWNGSWEGFPIPIYNTTFPKTNIAPENSASQKGGGMLVLWEPLSGAMLVSGRVSLCIYIY